MIVLRPPSADDEGPFLAAVRESRSLHDPWVFPPTTPETFAIWLQGREQPDRETLLACDEATGGLVAVFNVFNIVRGGFQNGTLGYYAFARFAGSGRTTEALRGVLAHAFGPMRLHRVEANIQPANQRSAALVRRCGFRHEGFSPRMLLIGGAWRDHDRYALTVEEWRAGGGAEWRAGRR